ncbi:MAG TPA: hypothetical protein VMQ44_01545 [Candidatus Saccharimonadales bacterium]|nr:hypothetical protein [Candidatus Saccharimonadales bacterium]
MNLYIQPKNLSDWLTLITEIGLRSEQSTPEQDVGYLVGEMLPVLEQARSYSDVSLEWRNLAVTALSRFKTFEANQRLFSCPNGDKLEEAWDEAIKCFS